jgi:crotonobetaine/carnitine-CoA ligase
VRRRGQNISSFEVETVVRSFSDVAEAAVVPERADAEVEDEVKAWVVLTDGRTSIDFDLLLRHCAENLPHYMVPRYFEVAAELPKTPSGKVRKHLLRERGNTGATWDRTSHGLDVTRRGVQTLAIASGIGVGLADRLDPLNPPRSRKDVK